jgi:mRNA-degrading endonuclease toxin of MazEF toxin-antitoxin module
VAKPFLKEGAFHLQQVQSVSVARLERRLGYVTADELRAIKLRLGQFLGM